MIQLVNIMQEEYIVRYPEEPILRVIPDDFPQRVYRKQQGPKDKGWFMLFIVLNTPLFRCIWIYCLLV